MLSTAEDGEFHFVALSQGEDKLSLVGIKSGYQQTHLHLHPIHLKMHLSHRS